MGCSLERKFWLFGLDSSCDPHCFSLFQTLLWVPCNHLLLSWAKCFTVLAAVFKLAGLVSQWIPVHYFALSFFRSTRHPISSLCLLPHRHWHYVHLVDAVNLLLPAVFRDMWVFFVDWFCCKSCFVLLSSWLLFLCADSLQKYFIILYKRELIALVK